MRVRHFVALAGMIVGLSASAGALAAAAPAPGDAIGGLDVIQVQRDDCHADERRHYLPEYDRRVTHYHRGPNCRAVIADDRPRDCHRDPQRHYLRELGRSAYHRHVGPSCRVETYREFRGERLGRGCSRVGPITICP